MYSICRKVSSVGRASALQAEGHRFEPCTFHQIHFVSYGDGLVAQLVRALACHARGRGFEPHPGRHYTDSPCLASVAQLVEQGTENPRVVGSIPTGGTICGFSSFGRAPPCQGGGSEFEPRHSLHFFGAEYCLIWCHSQVVRQSSAKAPPPVQIWVVPPKTCNLRIAGFFFLLEESCSHNSKKTAQL